MHLRTTVTLAGLLVLAATLAACGGSSYSAPTSPSTPSTPTGGTTTPTGTADLTINITGMNGSNSFSPNPGALQVGQKVAFHNADSISHTATADGGGFDTGVIAPGATSNPITMPSAGNFSYHCSIHPTMTGTLKVA